MRLSEIYNPTSNYRLWTRMMKEQFGAVLFKPVQLNFVLALDASGGCVGTFDRSEDQPYEEEEANFQLTPKEYRSNI